MIAHWFINTSVDIIKCLHKHTDCLHLQAYEETRGGSFVQCWGKIRFSANTVISSYSLLIRLTLEIIFSLFSERIHICTNTSVAETECVRSRRGASGCKRRVALSIVGLENPAAATQSPRAAAGKTKGFPWKRGTFYHRGWGVGVSRRPLRRKKRAKDRKQVVSPPFIFTLLGSDSDGRMHSKLSNAQRVVISPTVNSMWPGRHGF